MNQWFKLALGALAGIFVLNLMLGLAGGSLFTSNQMGYYNNGMAMNPYTNSYSTWNMPMHNGGMGKHGRMGMMNGMRY